MVFEKVDANDHEQILYCNDQSVGLKAIIAIHSTALGPATGGCRIWNYSSESEALHDVLRLSKGMTYKSSISGLNWGGGKAVILGDPRTTKTPAMLERFGEFVNRLGGNYITAKDMGIDADDLRSIKKNTSHILGIEGEKNSSGNPSPATAWGVLFGMQSCAQFAFNARSLKGMRIALQGLGSVAYSLLEHLTAEGAEVIGCDIDEATLEKAVKQYGIEIVSPDAIYDVKCDIFSPNALGATLNSKTLPRIQAKIIAGAANNQLDTPEVGYALEDRGIIYAPDYAINAGGVINIYYEAPAQGGYQKAQAFEHVKRIGQTVTDILERSRAERTPSFIIADRIAEERVNQARKLKK